MLAVAVTEHPLRQFAVISLIHTGIQTVTSGTLVDTGQVCYPISSFHENGYKYWETEIGKGGGGAESYTDR